MYILHTVLMEPTTGIFLTFESFLGWWSFLSFSWPWCVIQGWYCKEKLEASHSEGSKGWIFIWSCHTHCSFFLTNKSIYWYQNNNFWCTKWHWSSIEKKLTLTLKCSISVLHEFGLEVCRRSRRRLNACAMNLSSKCNPFDDLVFKTKSHKSWRLRLLLYENGSREQWYPY